MISSASHCHINLRDPNDLRSGCHNRASAPDENNFSVWRVLRLRTLFCGGNGDREQAGWERRRIVTDADLKLPVIALDKVSGDGR